MGIYNEFSVWVKMLEFLFLGQKIILKSLYEFTNIVEGGFYSFARRKKKLIEKIKRKV